MRTLFGSLLDGAERQLLVSLGLRMKGRKWAGDPKKGERKKTCDFIAIDHMKESLAFTAEVLISLTELHVLSVVFFSLLRTTQIAPHS